MEINLLGYKVYFKKTTLAIVIAFIIVVSGIIIESILSSGETVGFENKNIEVEKNENVTPVKSSTPTPDATDEIKVYVTGSVVNPGIITLKKGQIINDAINMAGGATEDADISSINMVYKLKENVVIFVKSKKEEQKIIDQNVERVWNQSQDAGPGVDIVADSGGALLSGSSQVTGTKKAVNINTATEAELDTLPGIGKETAKTIIEFRNKNGDFKDIRDIMKIPGIKESRFNSIKDLITVD